MGETTKLTVNAVVQVARELRTHAEAKRAQDPYADLYAPTDAAARKLCQRKTNELALALPKEATAEEVSETRAKGPRAAIDELYWRAAQAERIYKEEKVQESRRRDRHIRRLKEAKQEAETMRRNLTPLQRIATALAQLETVAAGPTTNFDAKVTGMKEHSGPSFPGDPTSRGREIAVRCARELEDEVESARRRRAEQEGKAA